LTPGSQEGTVSQHDDQHHVLHYHTCHNISGPEDKEQDRSVYSGYVPISEVLGLDDDENIREDLVEARNGRRTQVHEAIRDTLVDRPHQFSILNGGVTIVARNAFIDNKNKYARLRRAGLINGSQTQGELSRYLARKPENLPSVHFELIVTHDEALIAAISIARNYQNPVARLSISGRLNNLSDLETVMAAVPGVRLRLRESDIGDEFTDTEKLLQVVFAALPTDIFETVLPPKKKGDGHEGKVMAYMQRARCLKLFEDLKANGPKEAYQCFLEVAPIAWRLYLAWKNHQGFQGSAIRSIEREDNGTIVDVPDGIIFPIIAAHSVFMRHEKGHWSMRYKSSPDATLIERALEIYKSPVGHHRPHLMGRAGMSYSHLGMAAKEFAVS
jgi:hypothetical protein